MLAKSLQSCPTLCNPMDYSLPGSSVHGILQARNWSGWPCHPPEDLPDHGSNLCLLRLLNWHAGSLPLVPPGKPRGLSGNTEEGGLFLTQVLKPNNHHEGLCVQRLCFLLEDFASGVTRQFWAQWCCSRPCKLTDLLFSMCKLPMTGSDCVGCWPQPWREPSWAGLTCHAALPSTDCL